MTAYGCIQPLTLRVLLWFRYTSAYVSGC